jgi:phosphoribosylpyrophosphate synthetase
VVTDTAGTAQGSGKRVTLSIAPLLGQALRRQLTGEPVSPLLERWPVP